MATDERLIELSLIDKFRGSVACGILRGLFIRLGVHPLRIAESDDGLIYQVSVYEKSPAKAKALYERLLGLRLKKVRVRRRLLRKKDWQNRWKEDFKPFFLTRTVEVVPVFRRRNYVPKRKKVIFIDTTLAFGSGLHETTRFMANLIEDCRGTFNSFLDIGAGTGILSLTAFHNGAAKIRAVDIQKESIRTARENFKANNCLSALVKHADVAHLKGGKDFDFVAANLITHELIRLKRKILSFVRPGKFLAVSGISLENYEVLRRSFQSLPLRPVKIKKGRQWVAVLYKRKGSYGYKNSL